MSSPKAAWVKLIGISQTIISRTTPMVVVWAVLASTGLVTVYNTGNQMFLYVMEFVTAAMVVLGPLAVHWDAQQDREREKRMLVLGTRLSFALALFFLAFFAVSGQTFMKLWLGTGGERGLTMADITVGATVLIILLAGGCVGLAQGPSASVIFAKAKQKPLAILSLVRVGIVVTAMIVMGKIWGLIGVAVAIAIPDLLIAVFFYPRYVCKLLDLSLPKYVVSSYLPALAPAALAAGFLWFEQSLGLYAHIWQVGVGFLLGGMVFTGGVMVFCLNGSERLAWLRLAGVGREARTAA